MDQTNLTTRSNVAQYEGFRLLESGKRIAFIQAAWHSGIVSQSRESFITECNVLGIDETQMDFFEVPGSLEIPLQSKLLAKTGTYAIIVAAGLIVDGGIYRHDFVAGTVLDAMMQVQLETEVPILSVVLTPHHFQESDAHERFFFEHFQIKGAEAAVACAKTLKNLEFTAKNAKAA
ncbi:MAG: 6,7-dimethyl-8-ribityllumazine synthase [Pseudomonadota bacterium]